MEKSLVLAEKPSVGRDIAKVLGCNKNGNGFIEGDKYVVSWALGHLVTLADPSEYDKKYEHWKLEDLPMLPKSMKLTVIKKTSSQYHKIKELALRKDISEIIIATDAGREGELVARWIFEKIGVKKRTKRLWISSNTDKAILEGFRNLKDSRLYDNLFYSAYARSVADWYVGLNGTRALTTRYNDQLSCGRVQTPTLAIVKQRDDEIRKFTPKPYFEIIANISSLKFKYVYDKNDSSHIFDEAGANLILNSVKNKTGNVSKIDSSNSRISAPKPYDLTQLQKDANAIFGYSAKKTLDICQSLYESHKAITYPRTDSSYLSSDLLSTLQDRLKAINSKELANVISKAIKSGTNNVKRYVDDKKVSDHHAIIVTEQKINLLKLNPDEKKIYDLVVKRFIGLFLESFEYEKTNVYVNVENYKFKTSYKAVTKLGWKEAFEQGDEDDENLMESSIQFELDQKIDFKDVKLSKQFTTPPSSYTEGTLLLAMEKPGKFLKENEDLSKILNDTGGIGTVATRADIIEKLLANGLLKIEGRSIKSTNKGASLLELVPEGLKSPLLTAKWEKQLEEISKGMMNKDTFINSMMDYSAQIVQNIKGSSKSYKNENMTNSKCPECGSFLVKKSGRNAESLACSNHECKYRKTVSINTNARCPVCHKKMELKGDKGKQVFYCVCGHREKMEEFEKRKSQNVGKTNMNDIKKILEKENKSDEINDSPFALLAKLKS
jgi:DNA topoisomerase-3